ncbi:hypothetical protein LCGC14_2171150 [marine sediment metagenome]|uniref:Uncharacterized protein n=1 Tax=marine sediment metagenome TaxID=412755 RepID=A0A0F9DQ75_9ZZZZ
MGEHLINGEFQSDKYPETPRGLVPLKPSDPMAQDLLAIYAERRQSVDPEFSADLLEALRLKGHKLGSSPSTGIRCVDCKGPLTGAYYGAGTGDGQRFRCGRCHKATALYKALKAALGIHQRIRLEGEQPVCSRCGKLCLIRHKSATIELPEGYVYFHDAHEEDCWEQEKKARATIKDYEGGHA